MPRLAPPTWPVPSDLTASCSCGSVKLRVHGTPIAGVVCYCDDCQEGSRQIEALPNAAPVLEPDGGTPYILYRKDRVRWSAGAELLKGCKIRGESASSRMVASCCNSAMYMKFNDGRHWVPIYQARFSTPAPPLEMLICTKFRQASHEFARDLPSYPGYPLKFMAKLIAAWIPMLLSRRNT
ncbi:hypothetical protein [Piscinibacter gummiphilus]|uniref:CENP-V/GFA domain-containing protein n=1 Tax=Piscinibacter gummiphilus TaxID=946333 RepID=A0ABZ0CZ31_9BURK|nr:hypothetical protein [Piscinibacter gummiphilus]WOB10218.1 hypothetical protein RXV79_09160 [Piscinibacter gummiphilus]